MSQDTGLPTIGVVIATRNRSRSLRRTLAKLSELPERPPVVVVDNASTDDTPEVAVGAGARLIRLADNHGPAARTFGVRALRTDAVAFADDDSWWAPWSLRRGAELLAAHPRLALINARIEVGAEQRLDPTCAEMSLSPLPADDQLPGPAVLGFLACGAIIRTAAYLAVGGFDPHFGIGGEEQLLALDLAAAGWQLAYVDALVAHHRPSLTAAGREHRTANELRNELWSTWLRRAPGPALKRTLSIAAAGLRDGQAQALLQAASGLPWALRQRRRLPAEIERAVRILG